MEWAGGIPRSRSKNTSERAGDETVELYLSFPKLAGAPLRALRAFARIDLDAGALQPVKLPLEPRDLGYVNEAGDRLISAGDYMVTVGGGQPGTTTAQIDSKPSIRGEPTLPE